MVTMITLGIPGDVVTAILLGGLMIHSVQPGPLLMITNPEVVYGLFAALFLSNILFFVIEYSGVRLFTQVLRVQKYFLYPIIITMCLIGSYVNNNSMFEVFTMLLFGLIGYLMIKFGYSLPCLVIGFVLGGMIETNFLRAMMFDNGDLTPFLTRPFSLVFLVLTVLSIFFAGRRERKASARESLTDTTAQGGES
jgi:putative tricarboxylic transport membrane protein